MDNNELSSLQFKAMRDKAKKLREEKWREDSRKRLKDIAEKRLKSASIGAVISCEEQLGFLWGHDVPRHKRTEEQEEFRKIWNNLRKEILDKAGEQLMFFNQELDRNTIHWDRFQMNVSTKGMGCNLPETFELNTQGNTSHDSGK